MRKIFFGLLLLVMVFIPSAYAMVDEWPMKGYDPGRTWATPGASSSPLVDWSYFPFDFGNLNQNPVICDGTVYITSESIGEGAPWGAIYALDTEIGELDWYYFLGPSITTPTAISSDKMFFGASTGWEPVQYYAYSFDLVEKKVHWVQEIDSGVYASPIVYGGKAYFVTSIGTLYAYEVNTGDLYLMKDLGIGNTISSPCMQDNRLFIGSSKGVFYAFDALTGVEEWRYEVGKSIWTSPVMVDDIVYFSTRSSTRQTQDCYLYALNVETGEVEWSYEIGERYTGDPAYENGRLFVISGATLFSFNALTGEVCWSKEVIGGGPAVSNGVVYTGSGAYDACSGEVIWYEPHPYGVYGVPAISGNVGYVVERMLYAFSTRGGFFVLPEYPVGTLVALATMFSAFLLKRRK